MKKFQDIYSGKNVLVTGHTGFKGSWLSTWLNMLGARVIGVSLDVPTEPSNFSVLKISKFVKDYRIDIRDTKALSKIIKSHQPDYIFHLAAQSLVRQSYQSPLDTFSINALGSVSVLESLRIAQIDKLVSAVMITSDKVYDNLEWKWGYRETDNFGGLDPYSASKGMAELGIRSYVNSFFKKPMSNLRIGVTRAGNVIGGGDWAVDRVVPDCINAWSKNNIVKIRNPHATRPWQHVLEPLSGYLLLGSELSQNLLLNGEAYNFGPNADQSYSVSQLIEEMAKYWDQVRWEDDSKNYDKMHEAGLLKLNCDKSLFDLNWKPTLSFTDTVCMTVEWYKEFYQNNHLLMYDYTINQIAEYVKIANEKGIEWADDD